MKFVFKLLLLILFVPVFLFLLISATVRFQFLVPSFWENAFVTTGTYSKLSISINKNLESQTMAEGGKASDVRIFTDLITSENLKDTINRNINNVLQYANGKSNEIFIYVPVNKIPKTFLSSNFSVVTEQMKLMDLLKEINMPQITPEQIQIISRVGTGSWFFLIITCLISVLLLYTLYLLVDFGKRLSALGMALTLAGIVTSLAVLLGTVIRINWTKDLAESRNLGDSMIGIIALPIVQEVLSFWLLFAIITTIFGVVLFFIKKPDYNYKNNRAK